MDYEILEIYHTGNAKGKRWKPKVGDKYDRRRGSIVVFDKPNKGEPIVFIHSYNNNGYIITTPFVRKLRWFGRLFIETKNSIYELQRIGY